MSVSLFRGGAKEATRRFQTRRAGPSPSRFALSALPLPRLHRFEMRCRLASHPSSLTRLDVLHCLSVRSDGWTLPVPFFRQLARPMRGPATAAVAAARFAHVRLCRFSSSLGLTTAGLCLLLPRLLFVFSRTYFLPPCARALLSALPPCAHLCLYCHDSTNEEKRPCVPSIPLRACGNGSARLGSALCLSLIHI